MGAFILVSVELHAEKIAATPIAAVEVMSVFNFILFIIFNDYFIK